MKLQTSKFISDEFEVVNDTLQEVLTILQTILKNEVNIMSQIDELKAQVATVKTNISNLAADNQSAFSDLEAALNAALAAGGGLPNADIAQAITDLAAVNTALQTMDAAAKSADPKNAPVISSVLTLAAPVAGPEVSYQITASNSPTSFNAVGLPAGLTVDTTAGIISGIPTAAGVSNVTISAINASGTGVATLVITAS